jgi:hypothetical protein
MSHTFVEAQHAAELALASMAMRALLARETADAPEVASIHFAVTVESPGLSVIEVEVRDRAGHALGGYAL